MMKSAWPGELKTSSYSLLSFPLVSAEILTRALSVLLVLANRLQLNELDALTSYRSSTESCKLILFFVFFLLITYL